MLTLYAQVRPLLQGDAPALLLGETGVGKELLAHILHASSKRRAGPFVAVNCAAIPADLLEAEMFGIARGVATGVTERPGKFQLAEKGTLFLDEIGEMPPALQAKLLHVLQDRELTRLGSNRLIEVDVRVLAATNRDLEAMMRSGTFREDLYYRLQVIELRIPPLRERREEIQSLVEFFLSKFAAVYRRPSVRPSRGLLEALIAYPWPGNIRELENMMKRYVVLQEESLVIGELVRLQQAAAQAPPHQAPAMAAPAMAAPAYAPAMAAGGAAAVAAPPAPPMVAPAPIAVAAPPVAIDPDDDVVDDKFTDADGVDLQALARNAAMKAEREAIDQALAKFRWNRRKAAAYLKVSYKTLLNKMKECGISEPAGAS
jgi:transcriptional regulator with PAS, ATPase and Fis domain